MGLPVVKEGWSLIKLFLIFTITGYILGKFSWFFYLFALCSLLFTLFLIYFFRDPERKIFQGKNIILSPADGRIIEIGSENDKRGNHLKVIKIFMSPFNVHIQRAPISGKVTNVEYKKGKFLPAQKNEASEKNEQNLIILENDKFVPIRVIIKQIAGIFARRIICWTKIGNYLTRGEKIGMIIFGSQVALFVPQEVTLKVKTGDKVKAGLTVLASFFET